MPSIHTTIYMALACFFFSTSLTSATFHVVKQGSADECSYRRMLQEAVNHKQDTPRSRLLAAAANGRSVINMAAPGRKFGPAEVTGHSGLPEGSAATLASRMAVVGLDMKQNLAQEMPVLASMHVRRRE